MRVPPSALAVLLFAATTQPIHAQVRYRQSWGSSQPPVASTAVGWAWQGEPAGDSPWPSIGAGVGLGLGGWAVGGFSAAFLARDCSDHEDDYCEITAFLIGAAIGGTFGMALGVHAGNGWRGSLALDFLSGALVWGAGIGLAAASGWDDPLTTIVAVTVPVAQLATTVLVERATGRSRARNQTIGALILPLRDGRMGLGASVRF